jgi:hypothetical protein
MHESSTFFSQSRKRSASDVGRNIIKAARYKKMLRAKGHTLFIFHWKKTASNKRFVFLSAARNVSFFVVVGQGNCFSNFISNVSEGKKQRLNHRFRLRSNGIM